VINDPAYYQHYRDEVRSSFNSLLAAVTIYAAILGASEFRITEDQFLSTIVIVVMGLIATSVFNLITLTACRAHFNSKFRRAITDELRSVTVDFFLIERQNRLTELGLKFARWATFMLYISIVGLLVRYFTFSPTPTGNPPLWISLAPSLAIGLSFIGTVSVTLRYYSGTAWRLYVEEHARTACDWASGWIAARKGKDEGDTDGDD
jgi:hypothetical protein